MPSKRISRPAIIASRSRASISDSSIPRLKIPVPTSSRRKEDRIHKNTTSKAEKEKEEDCVPSSQSPKKETLYNFDDINTEIDTLFLLFDKNADIPRPAAPEPSHNQKRNQYRKLYNAQVTLDIFEDNLKKSIQKEKAILEARKKSVNSMTVLCASLEEKLNQMAHIEKYYCFDDSAQRDTLAVMHIRYDEMKQSIPTELSTADKDFMAVLGLEDDDLVESTDVPVKTEAPKLEYAELTAKSKLCEVALDSLNVLVEKTATKQKRVTELDSEIAAAEEELAAITRDLRKVTTTPAFPEYARDLLQKLITPETINKMKEQKEKTEKAKLRHHKHKKRKSSRRHHRALHVGYKSSSSKNEAPTAQSKSQEDPTSSPMNKTTAPPRRSASTSQMSSSRVMTRSRSKGIRTRSTSSSRKASEDVQTQTQVPNKKSRRRHKPRAVGEY